jgi:hypothetical protein
METYLTARVSTWATNPTSIHLTLAPGPLAEVDRWIEKKEPGLTRPEAIRRLVEIGLAKK